ncbi:hypothetical protein QE152_g25241 [Popillia japonica]|uniref:Retropepsins domain-containing protein n=1 Tax=Popillia japonica TaxID=7064 RepID=A0AAW1K2V7_POPJA
MTGSAGRVSSSDILKIECKINDRTIIGILDTASARNLADSSIIRSDSLSKSNIKIVGVGNSIIYPLGMTKINIDIEGIVSPTEVIVVQNLGCELILGYQFIKENGIIIDSTINKVTCSGPTLKFNDFLKEFRAHRVETSPNIFKKSTGYKECLIKLETQALHYSQPSKCHFGLEKAKILDFEISASGILPNTDKVKAISEFPRPRKQKDIQNRVSYQTPIK